MCAGSQINKSSCEENEEINTILHTLFVIHSEAHFSDSFPQRISRYSAYCSLLFLLRFVQYEIDVRQNFLVCFWKFHHFLVADWCISF